MNQPGDTPMDGITEPTTDRLDPAVRAGKIYVPRRAFLRFGAAGTAAVALGAAGSLVLPELRRKGQLSANGLFDATATAWADVIYKEVFPTSALILSPFQDELTIPRALRPTAWTDYSSWQSPPGPG